MDTLDVRPLPCMIFKHFIARDMISRLDVIEAYSRAIQVEGGSQFQAEFEAACAEKGSRLFVHPPWSPKPNGHVERAQRMYTEECHELYMGGLELKELNQAVRQWEQVYNHIRPHCSLDLMTPAEYLARHFHGSAPTAEMSFLP